MDARIYGLRQVKLVLHPIDFLFIAESFDERLIIGGIVLFFEGGELVKTLNE